MCNAKTDLPVPSSPTIVVVVALSRHFSSDEESLSENPIK